MMFIYFVTGIIINQIVIGIFFSLIMGIILLGIHEIDKGYK